MLLPLVFSIGSISFGPLTSQSGIDRNLFPLNSIILSILCWVVSFYYPLISYHGNLRGQHIADTYGYGKGIIPFRTHRDSGWANESCRFPGTAIYRILLDRIGILELGAYTLAAYRCIFVVFLI